MKLDPPLVFFLKHRERIEGWYALRREIPDAAHAFLCSLAEPLQELAPSLPGPPVVLTFPKHRWPKLFLVRPSWQVPNRAWPRAAVGMEWDGKKVSFDTAYSGVWLDHESAQVDRLRKPLLDALASLRETGKFETQGSWWPAWRYEAPSREDFWEDLDGFRDELLERLGALWTEAAPLVDKALEAAEGETA